MTLLPLFPLPNVVLFPDALLPLHIFEPRYRTMVADALDSDRHIGMVLLRAGFERDYEGRPPIFDVGCRGVIVHWVRLDDGRYNILLRGLERFRVVAENHERPYRRATVETLPERSLDEYGKQALTRVRRKLEDGLGLPFDAPDAEGDEPARQLSTLSDAEFLHVIAQHIDLEPIEKQALLECETLVERGRALLELIDIRRMTSHRPPRPGSTH